LFKELLKDDLPAEKLFEAAINMLRLKTRGVIKDITGAAAGSVVIEGKNSIIKNTSYSQSEQNFSHLS
jgi:hypothetical protein